MLTDKEQAALERLEAEKERRISEKIERGEAVRGPVVVVGAEESIDAELARAVARLRETEKREIVFPRFERDERGELREIIYSIVSGVPRPGRDENYVPPTVNEPPAPSIFDRRSAPREPRVVDDVTDKPPAQIEAPHAEMRRVRTQIEGPTRANPGGEIAEGWFKVEQGILHVEDMEGRLLGRQPVSRGDDVEALARKILREKRASDFYAPIRYH